MDLSDRFEGAARQQPSQHAERVERLACAHARTDGDRHPVLGRGLFERGGDDSLLDAGGDDQHPFAVAKDEVARRDAYPLDLDRGAEVDDLAARTLVLRINAAAEGREIQRLDPRSVTNEAIQDGARSSEARCTSRHQLTPKR